MLSVARYSREREFIHEADPTEQHYMRLFLFTHFGPLELNSVVTRVLLQVWRRENPSTVNCCDYEFRNMQKTGGIFNNLENYFMSVCLDFLFFFSCDVLKETCWE